VAEYWPEFATNGKEKATVRHILTHSVGIPELPTGVSVNQLCDYNWMVRTIERMTPTWEPGTMTGYHPQTFHWLAGETVRRLSQLHIHDFIEERIKRPWQIADYYIGIPDSVLSRIAPAYEATDSNRPRTSGDIPDLMDRANGLQVWRSIFRGISNARSLARIYAGLAAYGELDGARILRPERIKIASQLQTDAYDQTQRRPVKKGLGYRVDEGGPGTFGHTGGGGSLGFAQPDRRFAFAYAKNLHGGKPLSDAKKAESGENTPARYVAFKVRQLLGLFD
jgi:CubicO group peptidase (beta-lactamase class C family)